MIYQYIAHLKSRFIIGGKAAYYYFTTQIVIKEQSASKYFAQP